MSQFHGAELIAEKWAISREDMEAFALASHVKAARAQRGLDRLHGHHTGQARQRLACPGQLDRRARVCDRRVDLRPVAHDPRVGHQPRDVGLAERRDAPRLEAGEGGTERLALAQDRQPRQARLEALEHEALVDGVLVANRPAPLAVVVGEVVGGAEPPRAAQPTVGTGLGDGVEPDLAETRGVAGLTGDVRMAVQQTCDCASQGAGAVPVNDLDSGFFIQGRGVELVADGSGAGHGAGADDRDAARDHPLARAKRGRTHHGEGLR